MDFLAVQVGGPFRLLRDGHADVVVDDRWSLGDQKYLDMDYRMRLHGIRPVERIDGPMSVILAPLTTYLARKEGELDLSFALHIDPDHFKGATSLDSTGLWREMSPAVITALAEKLGMSKDAVRSFGVKAFDAGKAFMDNWGKSKK